MNPIKVTYYTGGTMGLDQASYVPRQADRDLFEQLSQGEFCYVLTSRQMGKSSLMVRVADELRKQGAAVALLDLTTIGKHIEHPAQWYNGLQEELGKALGLEDELEAFWARPSDVSPMYRLFQAIQTVVLARRKGPVVIFVDEIDYVRSLGFSTDEFFAAIRNCYNRRAIDPQMSRLTFCLLGVASPADLIADGRTTPFNIGKRVELLDFSPEEGRPLAKGLGRDKDTAERLLDRILYWTGGHPYLTQRLCSEVAERPEIIDPAGVDRACRDLFFSSRAASRDNNLLFVREQILNNPNISRVELLDLYVKLRRHGQIADDETDPKITLLRLSGLTRSIRGYLVVRNRIYDRIFGRSWIRENMPGAELRRQRRAFVRGLVLASTASLLVLATIGVLSWVAWKKDRDLFLAVKAADIADGKREQEVKQRTLAEKLMGEADRERKNAVLSSSEADRQRRKAQKSSADFSAYRARTESERGNVGEGLLWLAKTLDDAPAEDKPFINAIRTNFAAWMSLVGSTRAVLHHGKSLRIAIFNPDGSRVLTAGGDGSARLWDAATGKPVGEPMRHPVGIDSAAFSPDGSRVLTGDSNGLARVWDARTGQPSGAGMRHRGPVVAVAFEPNGKRALTASLDGTARLWDVSTGDPIVGGIMRHPAGVNAVAFSPDGKWIVTGCGDGTARLWHASGAGPVGPPMPLLTPPAGANPGSRPSGPQNVGWLAPEPRSLLGGLLALATSSPLAGAAGIETIKGEITFPPRSIEGITSVAFSPDGSKILIGGSESEVSARLWDAVTGLPIGEPLVHSGSKLVNAVAFSPDGKRAVTAGKDGSVKFWDPATGKETGELARGESTSKRGGINALTFSPDGRHLLVGGDDKSAQLWEVGSRKPIGDPISHPDRIVAVAFGAEGSVVLTAGEEGTARLTELPRAPAGGEPIQLVDGNLTSISLNRDGSLAVIGDEQGPARLWDVTKGKPIGSPLNHATSGVPVVAFSPDGRSVLTGGNDGTARLWDSTTGKPVGEPMKSESPPKPETKGSKKPASNDAPATPPVPVPKGIVAVGFSPDGRKIVVADRGNLSLWEGEGKTKVWTETCASPVVTVGFGRDGRLITGAEDRTVTLRDSSTGKPIGKPLRDEIAAKAPADSPAQQASKADPEAERSMELASFRRRSQRRIVEMDGVSSLTFSPDGNHISTVEAGGIVRTWEVRTGAALGRPFFMNDGTSAISADGKRIFSRADGSPMARVYDADTGQVVRSFLLPSRDLNIMALSSDGRLAATGGEDGTILLWDANSGRAVGGPLTHSRPLSLLHFSPDGKWLAGVSGASARVWDTGTGLPIGLPIDLGGRPNNPPAGRDDKVLPPTEREGRINGLDFGRDGKIFATTGSDDLVRFWEVNTGGEFGAPIRHRSVNAIAFSPDGSILATGGDGKVLLWDAATHQPIGEPLDDLNSISVIAFSPDGRQVAIGGSSRSVFLWDVATRRPSGLLRLPSSKITDDLRLTEIEDPVRPLDGFVGRGPVNAVAFSPDGTKILTGGSDDAARLWDATTGKPIGDPFRHDGPVSVVAFSPDGRRLAIGDSSRVQLRDAATGQPIGQPNSYSYSVTFSPVGSRLALLRYDSVRLLDTENGELVGEIEQAVHAISFSLDGKRILTGSWVDNSARQWDAKTCQPIGPPMKHDDDVNAVAYSPDGRLVATGGDDKCVRFWDATTGRSTGIISSLPDSISSLAFSGDGSRLIVYDLNGTAFLVDVTKRQQIDVPIPHSSQVVGPAFLADGQKLFAFNQGVIRYFSASNGTPVGQPIRLGPNVVALAFSLDGKRILTGGPEDSARLWDASTGKPIGEPFEHRSDREGIAFTEEIHRREGFTNSPPDKQGVFEVAFSPDGSRIAAVSLGGVARLWNSSTRQPVGQEVRHNGPIFTLAFNHDGSRLISAGFDGSARVRDAQTGLAVGNPLWHHGTVRTITFSPNGERFLAACLDGKAWFHDAATGKPVGGPLRHSGTISTLAFSPDGKFVLIAGLDGEAQLWDMTTAKPIGEPIRHGRSILAVAFSPDGKLFLTAGLDDAVRLWKTATAKPAGSLDHGAAVLRARFSPDGHRILLGGVDGKARLWDLATTKSVGPPLIHQGIVFDVAFSPDGTKLATAGGDHTARLWDSATGKPIGPPMSHLGLVHSIAFHPSGKTLLSGSFDGTARLWDTETAKAIGPPLTVDEPTPAEPAPDRVATQPPPPSVSPAESYKRATDGLTPEAINPGMVMDWSINETRLVTCSGNFARLWDIAAGRPIGPPLAHRDTVRSVALSDDDSRVLTGGDDGTARLWDATNGRSIGDPMKHDGPVVAVIFAPDGRSFATGTSAGEVRSWDTATGLPLGPSVSYRSSIRSLSFTQDGRRLITVAGRTAWLTELTGPAGDGTDLLKSRAQLLSGKALDEHGTIRLLTDGEWAGLYSLLRPPGSRPFAGSTYDRTAAHECFVAGDWHAAIRFLDRLIVASSDDASLFLARGQAKEKLELWGPAADDLAEALKRGADNPELRHQIATLYKQAESWDKAAYTYAQVVKLNPTDGDAWHERGACEGRANKSAEAVKSLDRAIQLKSDNWVSYYFRGFYRWEIGDQEGAFDDYAKAIAGDQNLVGAYQDRSRAYRKLGEWKKAVDDLNMAIKQKEDWKLYSDRAKSLRRLGKDEEALDDLNKAVQVASKDPEPLVERADVFVKQGKWKEAIEDYSRAIALKPRSFTYWTSRANVYAKSGDTNRALDEYTQAIEQDPEDPQLLIARADLLGRMGRSDRAFADYDRAIEFDRKRVGSWTSRGDAFAEIGRWDRAADDYAEAIKLNPANFDTLRNIARIKLGTGDLEGYRRECSRLIAAHQGEKTDLAICHAVASNCSLVSDSGIDPKTIVEISRRDERRGPRGGSCLAVLGAAHFRAGEFEDAVRVLGESERIAEADEVRIEVPLFLAMAHDRLGHGDEARKRFALAIDQYEATTKARPGSTLRDVNNTWILRTNFKVLRQEAEEMLNRSR